MTTDAAKLMRLVSWLSPAFPIGAYSYSHGLEWAVETGAVRDRATLVDWLDADLRHGAGRADGIFFAQAWRAVAPPPAANVMPAAPAQPPPLPWGEGGGEGVTPLGVAEPSLITPFTSGDVETALERLPPHPAPLPMGEGTGCSLLAHSLLAVASAPAVKTPYVPPAQPPPLPWGEGGGEGVMSPGVAAPHLTAAPASGDAEADSALSPPHPSPLPMGEGTGRARGEAACGTPGPEQAHPLLAVAELAAAMRATSELALESAQQGVAFLSAVRKAWPHPALDEHAAAFRASGIAPMLPIAAGLACAVHGIALNLALPLYLHAGAANLINAAVRLIPLGQTDGQMAVAALETAIAETAADALASGLEDIGSAAFMIDIASMRHETQYTRLFRS